MTDKSSIRAEKKPSGKRIFSFFALIFAFIASVTLWFYVIGYDSPTYEKEFTVSVGIIGESELKEKSGYTVLSDFGFSMKVTVSGPQSEVNKLTSDEISAYVDISGVTTPGKNKLPIIVMVENNEKLSVSDKQVEEAVIYIDKNIITEIPVEIQLTGAITDGGYSIGEYTVSPLTVTVEGPESEIAKVKNAKGEIPLSEIKNTVSFTTSVSLYDAAGNKITNSYVKPIDKTVTVTVPVYLEKSVPVVVHFIGGYITTDQAVITLSDEYVKIRGPVDEVERITEIPINVMENTIANNATVRKRLKFSGNIEVTDGKSEVTATIKFIDYLMKTITVSADEAIVIENLPSGITANYLSEAVKVTFMGRSENLETLTSDDFEIRIKTDEMFEYTEGETFYLPAEVIFKDGGNGIPTGIFAVGDYGVTVSFTVAEKGE